MERFISVSGDVDASVMGILGKREASKESYCGVGLKECEGLQGK